MTPVMIEVRCNLTPESPQWQHIINLRIEVGYPGRNGAVLWKHIGWLKDHLMPTGKSIAPAIWERASSELILFFDFLPVLRANHIDPIKNYRIRKRIVAANGRLRTIKSRLLSGDYNDEHFSLVPRYPDSKDCITP
ncbi:MAG: hypothetical protein IPK76_09175 [Lewinellaceae bacterium]|jgi:hypothetical protein|nr:hypothetical protein [Lewinellaceae bacterium]